MVWPISFSPTDDTTGVCASSCSFVCASSCSFYSANDASDDFEHIEAELADATATADKWGTINSNGECQEWIMNGKMMNMIWIKMIDFVLILFQFLIISFFHFYFNLFYFTNQSSWMPLGANIPSIHFPRENFRRLWRLPTKIRENGWAIFFHFFILLQLYFSLLFTFTSNHNQHIFLHISSWNKFILFIHFCAFWKLEIWIWSLVKFGKLRIAHCLRTAFLTIGDLTSDHSLQRSGFKRFAIIKIFLWKIGSFFWKSGKIP